MNSISHIEDIEQGYTNTVVEIYGGHAIVTLPEELDWCTTTAIDEILRAEASDPDINELTVDLSNTTFIDSSALGSLVKASRLLRDGKKDFKVRGINYPAVEKIFHITRLHRIFDISNEPAGRPAVEQAIGRAYQFRRQLFTDLELLDMPDYEWSRLLIVTDRLIGIMQEVPQLMRDLVDTSKNP